MMTSDQHNTSDQKKINPSVTPPFVGSKADNPLYPFTLPEGYFGAFKEQMMERIRAEQRQGVPQSTTIVRPLWRKYDLRSYAYIAAAVIILLLTVGYFTLLAPDRQLSEGYHTPIIAEMSEDDFQQFIIDDTADDYWGTVMMQEDSDRVEESYAEL